MGGAGAPFWAMSLGILRLATGFRPALIYNDINVLAPKLSEVT